MVGAVRFELTTSCTRNKRASRTTLRPEPGWERCPVRRKNAIMNFENIGGGEQRGINAETNKA